jgi:hypothetical protein
MARVETAPRIVFTFKNVVFKGMASWPPCHIVNNTPYAIWERVKGTLYKFRIEKFGDIHCKITIKANL